MPRCERGGIYRCSSVLVSERGTDKYFRARGSGQPIEKAQFRQGKSKEIQALFLDRFWPGLAGFGQIWLNLDSAWTLSSSPGADGASQAGRRQPSTPKENERMSCVFFTDRGGCRIPLVGADCHRLFAFFPYKGARTLSDGGRPASLIHRPGAVDLPLDHAFPQKSAGPECQ
jgi:hypothetical protein